MRFDPESKLGAILNGAAISGEADFNTLVNLLCVVQAVAHYARDNEPDRETILAACELLGEAAPTFNPFLARFLIAPRMNR